MLMPGEARICDFCHKCRQNHSSLLDRDLLRYSIIQSESEVETMHNAGLSRATIFTASCLTGNRQ